MEKQNLVAALKNSIKRIHAEQGGLFARGVREEAATFHLARELYDELNIGDKELDLDVEYNKNEDGSKDFEFREDVRRAVIDALGAFDFEREKIKSAELGEDALTTDDEREDIRPDIVVHKRGNHDSNVFVAEIKKGSKIEIKDAFKILFLTQPKTDYNYDYGAVVPLDRESLRDEGIFWVEKGEMKDRIDVD